MQRFAILAMVAGCLVSLRAGAAPVYYDMVFDDASWSGHFVIDDATQTLQNGDRYLYTLISFEITNGVDWDGPNTLAIQVEALLTPTRVPPGNVKSGPMAAFMGSTSSAKTMADGSLRVTIDLSPMDAIGAFTAFGSPGSPVAFVTRSRSSPRGRGRCRD